MFSCTFTPYSYSNTAADDSQRSDVADCVPKVNSLPAILGLSPHARDKNECLQALIAPGFAPRYAALSIETPNDSQSVSVSS